MNRQKQFRKSLVFAKIFAKYVCPRSSWLHGVSEGNDKEGMSVKDCYKLWLLYEDESWKEFIASKN